MGKVSNVNNKTKTSKQEKGHEAKENYQKKKKNYHWCPKSLILLLQKARRNTKKKQKTKTQKTWKLKTV